jgi:hypothetical protein
LYPRPSANPSRHRNLEKIFKLALLHEFALPFSSAMRFFLAFRSGGVQVFSNRKRFGPLAVAENQLGKQKPHEFQS